MVISPSPREEQLKGIFFDVLSQDESLFSYSQQYGQAGLAFYEEGREQEPWLNRQLLNTLGHSSVSKGASKELLEILCEQWSGIEQELMPSRVWYLPTFSRNPQALIARKRKVRVSGRKEYFVLVAYMLPEDRQVAEAFWQHQYRQLAEILNRHSFYLIKTDLEGRYIEVNDYFCERVGASREEVMGKPSMTYIIEEDHDRCIRAVEQCFKQPNEPVRVILRKPKPNGGYFTNEWQFVLMADLNGNPKEVFCIGHDISDQIEQTEELRQLRTIAKKSHNGVLVLSQDLNVLWANDGFCQITGLSEQEARKQGFLEEYFGKEGVAFAKKSFQREITRAESMACHTGGGSGSWLLVDAFPLANALNQQDGLVFICSDITEQKRIHASLKESQEMLENIANSIPGTVMRYITHPDGRDEIQFVSEGAHKLWGVPIEDVKEDSNTIWGRILPSDRDRLRKSMKSSAESLKPWAEDYRFQFDDEQIKWISARGVPKGLPGGETLWHIIELDITQRKEAEIAKAVSEERYKNITNSIPGGLLRYRLSADGSKEELLFSSKGIEELWGITPEEVGGDINILWAFVVEEDVAGMRESIQVAHRQCSRWDQIWRINHKSGDVTWVNGRAQPKRMPDGTTVWDVVILDITDKVHATQQWEKLAYVAEHSNDMLLTCNEQGIVTWANKTHEEMLGFKVKDMVGTQPLDFIKPAEASSEKVEELQQALMSQESFQGVIELSKADGEPCWIKYHATPIFNEEGKFLFSIVSKVDVSDLIERQKQMQQLLNTTVSQNERFKEYSYITSHNIRSSVSRILGLVELLAIEPEKTSYLDMLRQSAEKLDVTIGNMNDLLHLEKEFQTEEKSEYNITEALYRVVELNRSAVQSVNANISISAEKGIMVDTIPAYADSIMQNLVTNGLKYGVTSLSKKIEISLAKKGERAELIVKDYGVGIDLEKYQNRLFKLGSRLHNISKGHGMGLFMVKRQIDALGGSIQVESQPYEGTTFTVVF